MTAPLSLVCRQARVNAVRAIIDGGAMWAYEGTPPATPETTTAALLVGRIDLAATAGTVGAAGNVATLTLTCPRVAAADATGLIGWVRFVDSAGAGVMDLVAGIGGSLAPAIFSDLQAYTGGELQLVSCVISE